MRMRHSRSPAWEKSLSGALKNPMITVESAPGTKSRNKISADAKKAWIVLGQRSLQIFVLGDLLVVKDGVRQSLRPSKKNAGAPARNRLATPYWLLGRA